MSTLDIKIVGNTIRFLAADGVQKANSGHPGMPMGMADVATVLWTEFLKHNPSEPKWVNRDRFVLSAGHGSMLLYSMLYLSGYDVKLDDLKSFRQWGSRTPGHPEYGMLPGIETTTGPLGQGFGNGVGMAIAAKMTAARFDDQLLGNHYIYGIVSDGDLMEGVSHEALFIFMMITKLLLKEIQKLLFPKILKKDLKLTAGMFYTQTLMITMELEKRL